MRNVINVNLCLIIGGRILVFLLTCYIVANLLALFVLCQMNLWLFLPPTAKLMVKDFFCFTLEASRFMGLSCIGL